MPGPSDPSDLGLFPLGLVLLPGERIPLHVFEPRYRQLYADCVLEDRPFAVVQAVDGGIARVGCSARFAMLGRRFADGRMNVTVIGLEPVEVLEETSGRLYFSARVRPLQDDPAEVDEARAARVRELFARLAREVTGADDPPEVPDDVPLSYAVAGAVELEPAAKQELLELRVENERLDRVEGLLTVALEGADRARVASERAKTNGRVTLS
ncbi:MAG: LON peptidase substrate-binding domain-containing protein [Thermoleophilia bacterium]|nr:LON peptidase substrate-binding domain-containing protein [Thermoleophilia bacterium]